MSKYDFFTEYKDNQRNIFNETIKEFKSFLRLKGGIVFDKNRELNKHKNLIKKEYKYSIGDIQKIKQISNIYENPQNLQKYVNKLPKHSFAIWIKFKLKAPYFSRDDDEFYIIQNPCLKEKVFKVPMIRGSSWKGVLANAFKDLINNEKDKKEVINSFLRIFGAGSESIKAIENYLKTKKGKIKDNLLEFMLFELGIKFDKNIIEEINKINNYESLTGFLNDFFDKQLLKTKKGRVIFYPTYFDKLSLEIINPHNRKTKAGTNPIHYEVVPKGSEGIFQLIYIPFDGILENDNKIKKQANQDLEFLKKCIKKAFSNGIGAKTKLGWGRADIKDKDIQVFWSER